MAERKEARNPTEIVSSGQPESQPDLFDGLPEPEEGLVTVHHVQQALERLDEERKRVLVEARHHDIRLIEEIQTKIDEVMDILTREKLDNASPKDLAIILGILLDKREGLLAFDPTRAQQRQRKQAKFEFAFDSRSGRGAVRFEQGS